MISVSKLSLIFSDKKIFEDVNLMFLPGNCYGVIGANGAGKTTFLKLLSGEKESTSGVFFNNQYSLARTPIARRNSSSVIPELE